MGGSWDEKDFFLLYKVDSFGGSCGGEVHADTIVLGGVGNGKACFFFIK